jgi:hypothetical protein
MQADFTLWTIAVGFASWAGWQSVELIARAAQ